jgi:shikimate kinase
MATREYRAPAHGVEEAERCYDRHMESGKSVFLVGFMGAGKSTVGRLLARRLGLCFVETDAMIVAREGKSIAEVFGERGEEYFRQCEADVLDDLADKRGHVVATGGGFPCRPGVMERLCALGTVVWLAAEFDAAYERANRTGGRPMLAGRSREEVAGLFDTRESYYRRAHLAIDTTHLSTDQVVGRIIRRLRERERSPARQPTVPR